MADAKQNLARINDIFDEVTRQMNSLKRQAAKAERYAKLRDEMRGQLRIVLASRLTELEAQARQVEAELAQLTEVLHLRTEAVQAMDSEHAERTQHGYAIDTAIKQTRERLSQVHLEMERATARRRNNEERCAELTARAAAAEAEASSASGQLQRLEDELSANQQVAGVRSRRCSKRAAGAPTAPVRIAAGCAAADGSGAQPGATAPPDA